MADLKDGQSDDMFLTRRTLIARARTQDADAWDKLVGLYCPLVAYWCRAAGVHRDEMDDLIQDVFLAASTALSNFRHDRPGDTFRGWLRGITRNVLRVRYRQQKREPVGDGGTDALRVMQSIPERAYDVPDEDPPEQKQGLYFRALEFVRSEFEDRTWQMFWLSAIEERTAAEIAETFSVSTAAVRKARSRVLHRLKQELGEFSFDSHNQD